MHCNHCKVDLEENHKNCPLCGNRAVALKNKTGLVTAPYPKNKPAAKM
jgi:RNA polymerase subunit RPABC4/transcription elongation factor Spt4